MKSSELSGLSGSEQHWPSSHGWQGILDTIAARVLGRNRYDPQHFEPSPLLCGSITPQDLADIDNYYAPD